MCKSLIYTVNATPLTATVDTPIDVGSIIRKQGYGIYADQAGFRLHDAGYYDIHVSATFTANAVGDVTIAVYSDGVPVLGGRATETITTANTEIRSINIGTTVRVQCMRDNPMITIVAEDTAPTITNLAVQIEKA